MDVYHTIESPSLAEFRDRGSRFLAYAYPISSLLLFKERLASLKKEHPKAVHHCFAYRLGPEGTVFRISDDGEPSGSAGRPILGQIDSRRLTDTLVVVVRYFGGTLLGVPGLINAYKTVTAMAIDQVNIVEKQVLLHYVLEFDYTRMNDVMRLNRQFECEVVQQEQQLFCKMQVGVPRKNLERFLEKISELPGVSIETASQKP
jgi:uncharacterized YigZ family protein